MIFEKLIIDQQRLDEINKMSRTQRLESIKEILQDSQYIPNQGQLKNYFDYLVGEVDSRGFDTADNPILAFAINNKGGNPITREQAALLQNLAIQNVLDKQLIENTSSWLYNPRAYDGSGYKIKALVFLTNKNQYSRYGENPEGIIQEIMQTSDDERIKELLDNWQTRDGERSRRSSEDTRAYDNVNGLTRKEAGRRRDELKRLIADGTQDALLADWIEKNVDSRDTATDILRKLLRR